MKGARPRAPCEGSQGAVHLTRCLAGPDAEQQCLQLTRTPKVCRSTAPPRGGAAGPDCPMGGNPHDPLLACGGTEGRTPSRYTSGPGVGQQHLRRARTPRMGSSAGSGAVRCSARQHRPARRNGSPPRWSPTDASSLRAEVILVCHAGGLDAGLGIVHRDASGRAPYRRRGSRSAHTN
jgi:hypothetical protein